MPRATGTNPDGLCAGPAISLAIRRILHYMPRNIRIWAHVHRPLLDDILAVGDPFPPTYKEKRDVDYRRA